MSRLSRLEAVRFFDYVDSVCESEQGTVTKQDLINAVGVDLDQDGIVSDKKLYRSLKTGISKFTNRPVNFYEYKNEDDYENLSNDEKKDFESYIINIQGKDKHATELMICSITSDIYIRNFFDELKDHIITKQEFLNVILGTD